MDEGQQQFKMDATVQRHMHRSLENYEVLPVGFEKSREAGVELAHIVKDLPARSVLAIIPSAVARNILTEEQMRIGLKDGLKDEPGVTFLPARETESDRRPEESNDDYAKRIKDQRADKSSSELSAYRADFFRQVAESDDKLIVTDIPRQTLLGFDYGVDGREGKHDDIIAGFGPLKAALKGDEDLAGKLWMCGPGEFNGFMQEALARYPDIDADAINPAKMIRTPEEFAKNYVIFLKRLYESAQKAFGDRDFCAVLVTHDYYSDATTMACMGLPISIESLKQFGGNFRDFLESSQIGYDGSHITVKYRDQATEIQKTFEEVIADLDRADVARKQLWAIEFPSVDPV